MILSSTTIKKYVEDKRLSVRPAFDEQQLRPLGLRVHLGDEILIPEPNQRIDLSSKNHQEPKFKKINISEEPLVLRPGEFVLGCTAESFKLEPELACRLDGRSTLARLGLMVHCTAAVIDGNHRQHRSIVLEMVNIGCFELVIPYLHGIGMVVFETVSSPVDISREQDQYINQTTVLPPNLNFSTPQYAFV